VSVTVGAWCKTAMFPTLHETTTATTTATTTTTNVARTVFLPAGRGLSLIPLASRESHTTTTRGRLPWAQSEVHCPSISLHWFLNSSRLPTMRSKNAAYAISILSCGGGRRAFCLLSNQSQLVASSTCKATIAILTTT